VIDSLEEGDSLNLVQYDTTAEVVFKDGTYLQKEQLKEAVSVCNDQCILWTL
jgi:hypothetical protein